MSTIHMKSTGLLKADLNNPRKDADESGLDRLGDDMVARGVLVPLLAKPDGTLIDGWRRWLCPANCSRRLWRGSVACGWCVCRGDAGGAGQNSLRVVAVRSGCAVRVKFSERAREKRLVRWVQATTEQVAATFFGGKILAIAPSGVKIDRRRRSRGSGEGHLGKIG